MFFCKLFFDRYESSVEQIFAIFPSLHLASPSYGTPTAIQQDYAPLDWFFAEELFETIISLCLRIATPRHQRRDPNTMSGTFRSLIFHALPKFLGFQIHGYLIEDVRKRAFSPSVSRISQIMNL